MDGAGTRAPDSNRTEGLAITRGRSMIGSNGTPVQTVVGGRPVKGLDAGQKVDGRP